jgi:hypothetical protein
VTSESLSASDAASIPAPRVVSMHGRLARVRNVDRTSCLSQRAVGSSRKVDNSPMRISFRGY